MIFLYQEQKKQSDIHLKQYMLNNYTNTRLNSYIIPENNHENGLISLDKPDMIDTSTTTEKKVIYSLIDHLSCLSISANL